MGWSPNILTPPPPDRARALGPRPLGGPQNGKEGKEGRKKEREREERERERRKKERKKKEIVTRMAWGPKKIFYGPPYSNILM